ncbi:MAG: hypothetical protein HPY50_22630 [Firmicutes bacterium]|nr:hypothetical protein [Bacillota bacterium]
MYTYIIGPSSKANPTRGKSLNAQTAFLSTYVKCGNVTRAAKQVGIGRATHYNWLKTDRRYREAFEMVGSAVFDLLYREAVRRAVDGVERPVFYKGVRCGSYRHYSDRLLIKLLTIFNPDKYKS